MTGGLVAVMRWVPMQWAALQDKCRAERTVLGLVAVIEEGIGGGEQGSKPSRRPTMSSLASLLLTDPWGCHGQTYTVCWPANSFVGLTPSLAPPASCCMAGGSPGGATP